MASEHTTWKPTTEHGDLSTHDREKLPDSAYAFPKQRKEPLTDKSHVQNALSRFDQVDGVSDDDRDLAFAISKRRRSTSGWMSRKRTGTTSASTRTPQTAATDSS